MRAACTEGQSVFNFLLLLLLLLWGIEQCVWVCEYVRSIYDRDRPEGSDYDGGQEQDTAVVVPALPRQLPQSRVVQPSRAKH